MVSKIRSQRIADQIKQELASIIIFNSSDPRLNGVSITDVTVDRELAYANIYVSAVEGSERSEEILSGLLHAQGYLKRELSQRVKLRSFPKLRFYWDSTPEKAEYIEQLIASMKKESIEKSNIEETTDDQRQNK